MQIKIFTIPICDAEELEKEMNAFLRSHRVIEIVHEFVQDGADSRWCLLVKTIDGNTQQNSTNARSGRVDYKDILDEASFARFCALRKARKFVAEKEAVPAFAVFTDKQMAELAGFDTFSLEAMKKVQGIGSGKTEKYGPGILEWLKADRKSTPGNEKNETNG